MKDIKRCSISGVGFILESEAYNRLDGYLQSLRSAYKNNPDSEEIISDIEARIAELILSAQSSAENVVCLPLIENIIAQLGTPEDISGEEAAGEPKSESRIPRRLYRDLENNKLGGVCAGLAKYFNIEAVWLRLALFTPLLFLFLGNIPFMSWCYIVGGNLFGILFLTYLILWFAIPGAKSARQKLEQEGEVISARTIAERQGATQEERAKSGVASAVTAFGRFLAMFFKIMLGLLLFPIAFVIFMLIVSLVVITAGIGELFIVDIGNFDRLIEAVGEFGTPMMIFALFVVLIPAIYIAYLFITLLINKRPRWWVLFATIFLWLATLIGTVFSAIDYVEKNNVNLSDEDEIERIMKKEDFSLSRQIMEALDEDPDEEQQREIERLRYDANAKSIDR